MDFGLYRIMNAKRKEIMRFFDEELLPQVREELSKALGSEDPAQATEVKEPRERYNAALDIKAAENEVFSHLYNFFRRYYSEGDFISQRRYKEGYEKGPYAIPYHGEEVKLYWANYDQYYIKTSEYLRNYTFKLPSDKRVHFKLVEADTEKDNNRPQNGKERRFILSEKQPLAEENGELVIRFEYRPDPQKRKQADLNAEALKRILNKIEEFIKQPPEEFKKERSQEELKKWQQELASLQQELTSPWSPEKNPNRTPEKHPNRTLLEKHLTDYTARNTFDYFIHKDLGGFLRRELDFYIKNEVMHLDDIESDTAPRVEQYISKIKAIRRIAHKIIDFLAQLANFQKKLWLKKKFVVETQYCVTLDRVPEELYPEIAANDEQRKEWVRLFAIDKITGDLEKPGYSVPLTVEFLKANPYLVLDTRHFSEDFKRRLLASFDDLDEQCDGLLIHSENFQALNLLMERYRGQVKCIYIDPPFNTGDDFPYKDNFRNSSWIQFLRDRIQLSLALFMLEGNYFVHLDHNAVHYGKLLLSAVFSEVNEIIFNTNATKDEESGLFSYKSFGQKFVRQHDTILHGYNSTVHFVKLWKPNRNTSQLDLGQLDLISRGKVANPRSLEDFDFYIERYQDGTLVEHVIDRGDEKIFPIGDIWNDVYSFTQSEMRVSENVSFPTQKPENLLRRIIQACTVPGDLVMDFFAGSGTTAAVSHKLRRKYIVVEMGDYFETVYHDYDTASGKWIEKLGILGRMKNVLHGDVAFIACGKDRRSTLSKQIGWVGGGMFKYIRLESYEDTLNNLTPNNPELKRTEQQNKVLFPSDPKEYSERKSFREDYILHYMLEVESRGSPSLLNLDRFEDPFSYKLNIATGTVGETKPTVIDLVETFNYLIGLRVKTIRYIDGVCVVTGTNPQGERVLILWRNTKEMDNDKLDSWFQKQGYHTKGQEFDLIYVNGDNNLENLKESDQTWRVRLIEKEFRVRMFDVQNV